MKKYYCDFCERELYGDRITIKTNGDKEGVNIKSTVENQICDFGNWLRMDFCNKEHMNYKIFGEPKKPATNKPKE